jgi:hypothetical protein
MSELLIIARADGGARIRGHAGNGNAGADTAESIAAFRPKRAPRVRGR